MRLTPRAFFLVFALLTASTASARTWHIDPYGAGDAPTIQAGIDSAAAGDTVSIGCGTYYESNIQMKSAICLRSETGDPDCAVIDADGQSRVLRVQSVDSSTRIEGLTLRGAQNAGAGGGIWCYGVCQAEISNCFITDNHAGWGGGIGIPASSSPRIRDCVFQGNTAFYPYENTGFGGGIYTGMSTGLVIEGCTFSGNSAVYGGAIAVDPWSTPLVTSCVIAGNEASHGGGVYCNAESGPSLTSCTISGNWATRGGGLDVDWNSDVHLKRSILWGNCAGWLTGDEVYVVEGGSFTTTCSDVDSSGSDGVGAMSWGQGTLFEDPYFCDPESCENAPTLLGEYSLSSTSPCLDAPGCGLIGTLGQGCSGPTSTERTSWGSIKKRFR